MDYIHLTKEDIIQITEDMPTVDNIDDVVNLFKIFGDQTRLKILLALFDHELCVHDICSVIDVSQSAVSHQLRRLREAKLVKFRKVGKEVIYSIDDDHVKELFKIGLIHAQEEK